MNRVCFFVLPLLALSLAACDQEAIKKEAYDRGYADGLEAAKKQAVQAATSRMRGTALDRPRTGATPRVIVPGTKLQGTALDERPKR